MYYESKANPYDMDPDKVAELKKKAAEAGVSLEKYLEMRIKKEKDGVIVSKKAKVSASPADPTE